MNISRPVENLIINICFALSFWIPQEKTLSFSISSHSRLILKEEKKATFSRSFLIVFVFSKILSSLNVSQINVNRTKKSEREEEKERVTGLAVENIRFP